MEILRIFYLTLMFVGIGLFFGITLPCLNGPFNILKLLRERIGKPFSCPVCSFLWSVIIVGILSYWTPLLFYMILGSVGWGMLLMHAFNYVVFFEGMED